LHRSKLEVVVKILEYVAKRDKTSKTHILYYANLNTTSLEGILGWMTNRNLLISFKEGRRIYYSITPQGLQYPDKLRDIFRMMSSNSDQFQDNYSILESSLRNELGVHNCRIVNKSIKGHSGLEYSHQVFESPLYKYLFLLIEDSKNLSLYSIRNIGYSIITAKDTGLPLLIALEDKKLVERVTSLINTDNGVLEVKIIVLRNVGFI